MVPYYLQDANAPLPSAFKEVGWNFAMWIVSIGGLVGLLASLFGALFPLPRVMYSMAQDGLLFRFLGRIHPRYRVPVIGSIFAAILTALIAGLFDLAQLVNLLSIGTLLAYSVVAISITILRYMDNSETFGSHEIIAENGHANGGNHSHVNGNGNGHSVSEHSLLTSKGERATFKSVLLQLFNCRRVDVPNALTTRIVGSLITLFCFLSMGIGLIFMQAYDALINNQLWVLVLLIVLVVFTLLVLIAICLQPREAYARVFRVPLVPLVPAISIFINIYLMLQLDVMTWIRFGVWMAIGIPMFIACWCMYDIKNPAKRHPERVEFERLLKSSRGGPGIADNFKAVSNVSTATTVVMQQNERSVKSLDEIMDMNEVSDDLMVIKQPNGQINYVEDTKSDKSHSSVQAAKEPGELTIAPVATKMDTTTEEEKSVIAMLDDVLQTEDDGLYDTPFYDRKISVDSEMVPSVIRSTTVATVHSSSSDSSEIEEGTEDNITPPSVDSGIQENYQEKQKIAMELVEEILNSPRLWMALEKHQEEQKRKQLASDMPNSISPEHRAQSVESLHSVASVEDPLHSERFRNKLSQLIMKPPEPKTPKEVTTSEEFSNERPKLKHSKSEADVRKLVLKAIEGCDIDIDNVPQAGTTSSQQNIPKPPKFDPVLYKTINTLGRQRERPSLDKLLRQDEQSKPRIFVELSEPQSNDGEEVPFKQKLEAILKRGPSHKTQTKPEVEVRRPRSAEPHQQQEEEKPQAPRENLTKSQSNLNALSASMINETRRTLRSVKQKQTTEL
uniref:AA permease n=1 Tax=Musca domestica TaxID=7370 RepID=T1PBU8_MUSDO